MTEHIVQCRAITLRKSDRKKDGDRVTLYQNMRLCLVRRSYRAVAADRINSNIAACVHIRGLEEKLSNLSVEARRSWKRPFYVGFNLLIYAAWNTQWFLIYAPSCMIKFNARKNEFSHDTYIKTVSRVSIFGRYINCRGDVVPAQEINRAKFCARDQNIEGRILTTKALMRYYKGDKKSSLNDNHDILTLIRRPTLQSIRRPTSKISSRL